MVKFIFTSNIVGFTTYDYRIVQYEEDGEYYAFWIDKEILIGTFQKRFGVWQQVSGRQMPDEFPKYLGQYIEINKLWS